MDSSTRRFICGLAAQMVERWTSYPNVEGFAEIFFFIGLFSVGASCSWRTLGITKRLRELKTLSTTNRCGNKFSGFKIFEMSEGVPLTYTSILTLTTSVNF